MIGLRGIPGAPPNGAITDWDKKKSVYANEFKENSRPVMVSTAAFGMGIDKPNIRYTVNIILPSSIEAFVKKVVELGVIRNKVSVHFVATGAIGEALVDSTKYPPSCVFNRRC